MGDWEIGYTGIQNRYVASIGKVKVLHDCTVYLQVAVKSMQMRF